METSARGMWMDMEEHPGEADIRGTSTVEIIAKE